MRFKIVYYFQNMSKVELTVPNKSYEITLLDLVTLLNERFEVDCSTVCSIMTDLKTKEKRKVLKKRASKKSDTSTKLFKPLFKRRVTVEILFLQRERRYICIPLIIQRSTIANAGLGVFAGKDIPIKAEAEYEGERRDEGSTNMYYSWEIKEFNKTTGRPKYNGKTLYYLDASNIKRSNWTRFVNCNLKKERNNLIMHQRFDRIIYQTKRKIKKGEELFIHYGDEYIENNL